MWFGHRAAYIHTMHVSRSSFLVMVSLCSAGIFVNAQTNVPTHSPSTSAPTAPTSSPTPGPTAAPTITPFPVTPLVIDILNFSWPVEESGAMIGFHVPTSASVARDDRYVGIVCSELITIAQVTESAYNSCDARSEGVVGNLQTCQSIGQIIEFTTRFAVGGQSMYFVSFTDGTDNSGGYCTTRNAKVEVQVVDMTVPANIWNFGCYEDDCQIDRVCHESICDWGQCRAAVPLPINTLCSDSNPMTTDDRCSVNGMCAGLAHHTFTLRLVPTGATSTWYPDGNVTNNLDTFYQTEQIKNLLSGPLDELDLSVFTQNATDGEAICTFYVQDYRQYSPDQLELILAPLLNQIMGYQLGTFQVRITEVLVSPTPGATTTTTAPSTQPTPSPTIAASLENNNQSAEFPIIIVAGAGGGFLLVLIIVLVVCCCCKGENDSKKGAAYERDQLRNRAVTETHIDSATRSALAATSSKQHIANNYLDVESAVNPAPKQFVFTPGKSNSGPAPPTTGKPVFEAASIPAEDSAGGSYIDADVLESKMIASREAPQPPQAAAKPTFSGGQDNYLDLSNTNQSAAEALKNNPFAGSSKTPKMPPPLPSAPPPTEQDDV